MARLYNGKPAPKRPKAPTRNFIPQQVLEPGFKSPQAKFTFTGARAVGLGHITVDTFGNL
jgi:hypothetical protein